jgi:hypothetical protein
MEEFKKLSLMAPDSSLINPLKKEMVNRYGAVVASQLSWEMIYRLPLVNSNAWVYRYWRDGKQKICVDAMVYKPTIPLYVRFCQTGSYSANAQDSQEVKNFVKEAIALLDTDDWKFSSRK